MDAYGEQTAIIQAPLQKLKCDIDNSDRIELAENLFLVRKSNIQINEDQKKWIGTRDLSIFEKVSWGFEYIYEGDPAIHAGEREKAAKQVLFRTLLALWISRPNGSYFSYIAISHRRIGDSAHTVERFNPFIQHVGWVANRIDSDAIEEFHSVFAGLNSVLDEQLALRTAVRSLHAALSLGNWDLRLINLTIALECLFSPGGAEIKHKLSERAALFLHDSLEERRKLFDDLRNIYDLRSTLVHGSEPKASKLDEGKSRYIMMRLESIVQGVLKKILMNSDLTQIFSQKRDKREAFFADLLFPTE
jgi:hypothetical protein